MVCKHLFCQFYAMTRLFMPEQMPRTWQLSSGITISPGTISHLCGQKILSLSDFDHFHDDSWPKDWPNPDEKTKHVIIRATKVPNESIIQPIIKQPKLINAAAVMRLTQFLPSYPNSPSHPDLPSTPNLAAHPVNFTLKPSRYFSANFTPIFLYPRLLTLKTNQFSIGLIFTPNRKRVNSPQLSPGLELGQFLPRFR